MGDKYWRPEDGPEKMRGSAEPQENKCGAKLRGSEEEFFMARFCTQNKGHKTTHPGFGHCWLHGGRADSGKAFAGKEMAKEDLKTLSEKLGRPVPIGDPIDEILAIAAEIKAFKDAIRAKLDSLGDSFTSMDKADIERVRALLTAYHEVLITTRDTMISIQKIGLRERKLQLEEQMADLVATCLLGVLMDHQLQLSDSQLGVARELLAHQLTTLSPQFALAQNKDYAILDVIDAEVLENDRVMERNTQ